ncbi:MAG: S41 family peptidase [Cytophagales bacterium]|nr:S41 family peptidase [Cytophagales bacterium]
MKEIKNTRRQILFPIIIALAVIIGILLGLIIGRSDFRPQNIQSQSNKFSTVLNYIQRDYVDEVSMDTLVEHAISSTISKLDPHTSYIPAKDQEIAQSQLNSSFEGIGIEFNMIRDTLYIMNTIKGGPSEKAGILAGDKIIKVNDSLISGVKIDYRKIYKSLRGEKGSKVKVSVQRKGHHDLVDIMITRGKIPTPTISSYFMMDFETGYIKVDRFGADTDDEFVKALKELRAKRMQKLVLDLRDNGGGYLGAAINILEELLPKGRLLLYTKAKNEYYNEEHHSTQEGYFETRPVVVLINEHSASASEIVTGALQDNDRALVVGRRSYGKGLVQIPLSLEDGSELRLTISRYYTPSGRSIQRPYTEGNSLKYRLDLLDRDKKGELYHKDSIHHNNSKKYLTVGGRTVYGGGGITPDVFVAKDTSFYSPLLKKMYGLDIIRRYVIDYIQEKPKALQKFDSYPSFSDEFEVTDQMFDVMIRMAERNGIKVKQEDIPISKEYIKKHIKATIARYQWGDDGYHYVLHQTDDFLKDYQKLFVEAEELMK